MQEVQTGVKRFVTGAHNEQDRAVCVIQPHDWIFRHVDEFVTGLALQESSVNILTKWYLRHVFFLCLLGLRWAFFLRVQIYPVAGDVNSHAQLKPESVGGIEEAQRDQKTHRAHPVRQLIQNSTEFRALIVIPGRVAVYRV